LILRAASDHNRHVRKRRNGAAAPEVLRSISEGLLAGTSASNVRQRVAERFGEGATPSLRAIQEIANDLERDDSPAWTLEDATPQDVSAVLATLREVEKRSGGRIRQLTRRTARLVAIYQAAGHDPWTAYVAAREYLALANGGGDLVEETLALARSTGEDLSPEQADELDVDYPAGMIDPFVKKVTARS
jgi:hypothetical protein